MVAVQVALGAAKKAVGAVAKEQRNAQQGFNFRGVDAVVNAAAPKLNEEGIVVLPEVLAYDYETIEIGAKKTAMGHVMLKVKYSFYGPEGDHLEAVVISESMDAGDKGCAKAMSVAYRIALLQVLNLPTDEPDPDMSSYERSAGVPDMDSYDRSAGISRPRETAAKADPAKVARMLQHVEDQDFVKRARNAKTVDEVRTAWKAAGAAGALKTQVVNPVTGEVCTLQEYFTYRADEIGMAKAVETVQEAFPEAEVIGA